MTTGRGRGGSAGTARTRAAGGSTRGRARADEDREDSASREVAGDFEPDGDGDAFGVVEGGGEPVAVAIG
ncbi:hypothetical protein [Planomonospora sp. ID82291]|uniref:hypothetical protein n=1 Tax=Planomonospora sp. ID82291 TaxID=2738136 RepID=UPI0018C3A1D3|nr:hypothetical protein [Planomonospora sp. ID82291]MBG0819112.1 hypothetical protein [Planomonospora sp. ID82291]